MTDSGERLELPPRQAAVLAWRLLADAPLSWREIANRLGITQEQAKVAYSAACSKIRRYAGAHYPLQGANDATGTGAGPADV